MFDFDAVFSTFFFLLIFGFIYFLPLFLFKFLKRKDKRNYFLTELYFSFITLPYILICFGLVFGNSDVDDYWNPTIVFTVFFFPIFIFLSLIPMFLDSAIQSFSNKKENEPSEK